MTPCPKPRSRRPSATRSSGSAGPTSWSGSRASRTPRRSAMSCAPRRPASSSTSPTSSPVLVNSDAGSPDGTGRVVVETEPPDYIEQILLVRPTNRLERVSLTYPEIDGVGGKGAALRTIFEIADALKVQALVVVDSDLRSIVPEWIELLAGPDPQGRLRLRGAALRPLQVRRHDHQHRHLSADPGAVRPSHPPADRRRLRGLGRPRPALPRARRLDARHQPLRHRHLDDDVGADRRLRGLPDAARGQDPRPQGPGLGPRADVPPGRRDHPAAGQPLPRAVAGDPRQPRRPGLRLRADHRAAAARGEHAPPAVRVPRRVADPRPTRGRGCSRRPRSTRSSSSRPRRAAWRTRRGRGSGVGGDVASDQGVDARDGRRGRGVPLPGRRLGAGRLRPDHRGPRPEAVARDAGRGARADLLRAGRRASSSRTAT